MQKNSVKQILSLRFRSELSKAVFILILVTMGISQAFATCYTVSPSGSGSKTGQDWNNTLAWPVTFVRGDVYYLQDGTYAAFKFTTAVSGTSTVEIRKAQSYDNCTSTGWSTSTMGSAQAVFQYTSAEPLISVETSYLTINGNGTYASQGCGGGPGSTKASGPVTPSDCGIKIDNSTCTSTTSGACNYPVKSTTSNITNLTMEYVEAKGNNTNSSEANLVFAGYSGDSTPTFTHDFMHNAGCVFIQDGLQDVTATYSYFWGNNTNASGCHGQAVFDAGADSNGVFANNIFRDIVGTSIWTFAATSTTHNNWLFYNNVIWADSSANDQQEDGIIACINSGTICTNFMVMQNTMVNLNYSTGTVFSNSGGSITFENNLWYLNQQISGSTLFAGGPLFTMNGSTLTEEYNSSLASGSTNPFTGAYDVNDASASDPFVNWQSGNFKLASENADWDTRLALGSPYTTDPTGKTRTTDRGAYQY
jgi:hypothetical protein